MKTDIPYNIFQYQRHKTQEVRIGKISIGCENPVRIQSMCNVPTSDIDKSVAQAKEIFRAGGEMVRYSLRHKKDAAALPQIREQLTKEGFENPIVADVHFNAELALHAAKYIEKVRINPGNFVDKRATFNTTEYSDEMWKEEIRHMEEKLSQLLEVCKKHHTAIRIGTNHGSLSDRIMSRYGNTVEGMVESTMEMLRICKKNKFFNVVVSLKSSNVRVMVMAYRNLVAEMHKEKMAFPLHLGVTEAGDGLSGRIKSASGIGTLLNDGLGDTIRVSLTENPVAEIPVAKTLVKHFANRPSTKVLKPGKVIYNPFSFKKRETQNSLSLDADWPAVVIDLRHLTIIKKETIEKLGYKYEYGHWIASRRAADYVFVKTTQIETSLPENLRLLYESDIEGKPAENAIPVLTRAEYVQLYKLLKLKEKWVYLRTSELTAEMIDMLKNDRNLVIILETTHPNGTADQRSFFLHLNQHNFSHPVIVKRNYIDDESETFAIKAAADIAPLFTDGFGNGLWITNPFLTNEEQNLTMCFEILQAARARSTSTEYIACPSCGRTQFDIEKVLHEVRERTSHLYHLKIGVMGCIVNGPGEMADADYGYVGAAPGKVVLYKGKKPVRKNISSTNAVDELIQLIKDNGDWISP